MVGFGDRPAGKHRQASLDLDLLRQQRHHYERTDRACCRMGKSILGVYTNADTDGLIRLVRRLRP